MEPQTATTEREPGPIWGGWWGWEPPPGAEKECQTASRPMEVHGRVTLHITSHAIRRWQQRIEDVSDEAAALGIVAALQSAKAKHFRKFKVAKETFYIPTPRAILVGSKHKIVTVLPRNTMVFDIDDQ